MYYFYPPRLFRIRKSVSSYLIAKVVKVLEIEKDSATKNQFYEFFRCTVFFIRMKK